jgi:hypothetical protein
MLKDTVEFSTFYVISTYFTGKLVWSSHTSHQKIMRILELFWLKRLNFRIYELGLKFEHKITSKKIDQFGITCDQEPEVPNHARLEKQPMQKSSAEQGYQTHKLARNPFVTSLTD